ncbi:hypothetical protein C5167_049384 [Papaver somniferum]|uniref:DUF223 domain-containing protein n=1 Tax=Papaver somniferum TaxID=3469 RepID=A0A4Y7KKP1_PAPSO|nr:hypothetical protein C5167_049384 [Papaver somniferum]
MGSQIRVSPSKLPVTATYNTFLHVGEAEEGKPLRIGIFMKTSKVRSLDIFILDDDGAELHGVVPKNILWKFDPLPQDGRIYSLRKFTILGEKKIILPTQNEHLLFFN